MLNLTASDYNPMVGEEITITLSVKNQGDTTAYGFYTDWYQDSPSPPPVPSTGDYYWWENWLDANSTVQFTHTVTNNKQETWDMYGLTDSYGYVAESNECNNVIGPVVVNWWGPPDLIVEQVVVSDTSPFIDEYIDVTVTINNQGGPAEGSFRTDLYYNRSTAPPPYTPGNQSFSKNGMSPGESYSYIFSNIPYQSPFLWKMWVYVDSWLNIQETNENNNIDSMSIFWKERPISDNYGWTIHPYNQQHTITGTFMEWRSGGAGGDYNQHFHDGIDIPAPENTPVYSVSAGQVTYNPYEPDALRVGSFWYKHLKDIQVTSEWVNSDSLIAKIADYVGGDHLHFSDGLNQQEVNPLREDGIDPFTDNINPIFYENPITLREDDPNVGGWNGGADGAVISKDSVYGNVDIIVHAKDEINSGIRVGLYALSYQVCNRYYTPIADEVLNFTFDNWYDNYYVNFIYADTFKYIITNQLTSNGYWKTTDWFDGTYCLKIKAYDVVSFYKKFVLKDTTNLNVTEYLLQDVQLKNGLQGNHDPEIEGHIHCKYPHSECGCCFHHEEERTIEINATDQDGDPLHYVWLCYYGYFIVGGYPVPACTTYENYVLYQAPSSWYDEDLLYVYVYDNRGGYTWTDGFVDVFDPGYSCICGDVNGDGSIGLGDVVYLTSYLYKGYPAPPDPIERADVNNDCVVDLADLVYFVNYQYKGGDAPECCWIH